MIDLTSLTFEEVAPWCVGAELVIPLLAATPLLLSKRLRARMSTKKRKELTDERAREATEASRQGHLVPLQCPSCSAPVALDAESFACPHCGAHVTPPPEYLSALRDRRRAEEELRRAVRMWRSSRILASMPFVWFVRLVLVMWTLYVALCASTLPDGDDDLILTGVALLCYIVAGASGLLGWVLTAMFVSEAESYPPLPKRSDFHAAPEAAACTSCGAPVQFPTDTLATICTYCRAENYRAGVARAERGAAMTARSDATKSLLAAMRDHEERRSTLLGFVAFLAILEVAYGIFVALSTVWDSIFG